MHACTPAPSTRVSASVHPYIHAPMHPCTHSYIHPLIHDANRTICPCMHPIVCSFFCHLPKHSHICLLIFHLSTSPSTEAAIHPRIHPTICASVKTSSLVQSVWLYPAVHQINHQSINLFIHPFIHLFNSLLIDPCTHTPMHPCIHVHPYTPVYPSIDRPSVYLFITQSTPLTAELLDTRHRHDLLES